MNLLIVTQYFHPENFRVNELVATLVARKHEVTVLTGQPNYPTGRFFQGYGWNNPRKEKLLGADVIRTPTLARGDGGRIRLAFNYLWFAFSASITALFRLKGPYDAIVVFEVSPITVAIPAIVASRKYRAPVLLWVLDLWPDSLKAIGVVNSPRILKLIGHGVRWIYFCCAQILVQSRAFEPQIIALGVKPDQVRYFPNWIEAEYEHLPPPVPYHRDRNQALRIIYAGNIGVAQDFPAILDAASLCFAQGIAVRWIIAGDGRMSDWVRLEVKKRGISDSVEFLGQLPAIKMPALFSSADALLVSLRSDPIFAMTIPGKVQSYLSAAKPILAMLDGEGARVLHESGAGMVVSSGNSAGLAEVVAKLVKMPIVEREEMGRRGRAYALREFSREKLFNRLEKWLLEVTTKTS